MKLFVVLTVLLTAYCAIAAAAPTVASVMYDDQAETYTLKYETDKSGAAWGSFDDTLTEIGWGKLNIFTNNDFEDDVQMHAAGYLEGALTHEKIWTHRDNLFTWYYVHYLNATSFSQEVYDFLWANKEWVYNEVKNNPTDPYWKMVGLTINQYEGLAAGYAAYAGPGQHINASEFWVYESAGDLLDLTEAFPTHNGKPKSVHERAPWWQKTESDHDFTNKWTIRNRCSGLIKVLPDKSEIYTAQVAWFMSGAMNRILKQYNFDLKSTDTAAKVMTFSSYPGLIFSWDDFYVLDSGLAVIETTFSIFNTTLYKDYIRPNTVFDWLRVSVANRMSTDGSSWNDNFAKHNSGSYNNQWIIVDYNKFTPGADLNDNLLWVVEQAPGNVIGKDCTDKLRTDGYMPSFNTPHFPEMIDICNYTETVKAGGPHVAFWTDPNHCCRANIFRRDHVKVHDLESMKHMMRYNDWQHDPLSVDPKYGPDAGAGIASRYDLRPKGYPRAMAFMALDGKVTSFAMHKKGEFTAISSPTYDDQPAYSFSGCQFWAPHTGLPDKYEFPWVDMVPEARD